MSERRSTINWLLVTILALSLGWNAWLLSTRERDGDVVARRVDTPAPNVASVKRAPRGLSNVEARESDGAAIVDVTTLRERIAQLEKDLTAAQHQAAVVELADRLRTDPAAVLDVVRRLADEPDRAVIALLADALKAAGTPSVTKECAEVALASLRAAHGGPTVGALSRLTPSIAGRFDDELTAAWVVGLQSAVAETAEDGVVAAVAESVSQGHGASSTLLDALRQRAIAMSPGPNRREVLTCLFLFDSMSGKPLWQTARAAWDRQTSGAARDDVAAAYAAARVGCGPHAPGSDAEAAELRADITYVFASTTDADVQRRLAHAASMELLGRLPGEFLRDLSKSAVSEPLRGALAVAAAEIARAGSVDWDAFDRKATGR
jgi:hypothetical protein